MIPSSRTPPHELLARAASHPKVTSVLHLATWEDHYLIVAQLLTEEPSLANASKEMFVGWNVLDSAAGNGKEKMLALLLAMSPLLLYEVDSNRNTPLHNAVLSGHKQIVPQLLAADPSLVNKVNDRGWTALHCAVAAGFEDVMDMLLAINPQLVFVVGEGGETILHLAGRSDSRSKTFYAKLLALNPEALRAEDSEANTIFSLVVERNIDCAIDLLQWQLTFDEIVSAFTKHNKSYDARLWPIVEPQFAHLVKKSLLNQDVVGIVLEFLGLY